MWWMRNVSWCCQANSDAMPYFTLMSQRTILLKWWYDGYWIEYLKFGIDWRSSHCDVRVPVDSNDDYLFWSTEDLAFTYELMYGDLDLIKMEPRPFLQFWSHQWNVWASWLEVHGNGNIQQNDLELLRMSELPLKIQIFVSVTLQRCKSGTLLVATGSLQAATRGSGCLEAWIKWESDILYRSILSAFWIQPQNWLDPFIQIIKYTWRASTRQILPHYAANASMITIDGTGCTPRQQFLNAVDLSAQRFTDS